MGRKLATAYVVLWLASNAGVVIPQNARTRVASEPRSFYEDDDRSPFWCSAALPTKVLDVLRESQEAKSSEKELKGLDREDFAKHFQAVSIHLGGPQEIDYVVLGEYPMGGADAPWFWIVRSDEIHPKVIFFTFANDFELLKVRDKGYPRIRSHAYAGGTTYTNIYQYNGQRYMLVHKYQKETEP